MRPRLLPILIVAASLALTLRLGDIWSGLGGEAAAEENTGAAADPAAMPSGPATTPEAAAVADTADAPRTKDSAPAAVPRPEGRRIATLPDDPLSMSDEEIGLLQELAERRRELEARAEEMDRREALLKAAERRIDEKVAGLQALQRTIEELVGQHDEQTESQYQSLVKIYENMKPKDAARIFEELDMAVLLPVVERMKERKIAPILAELNPDRAKSITTELAQRRALPIPEQ